MPHVLSNTTSKRRRLLTLLLSLAVALAGVVLAPAAQAVPSQVFQAPPSSLNEGVRVGIYPPQSGLSYQVSVTTDPGAKVWKPFSVEDDNAFPAFGNVTGLQNFIVYYIFVRAIDADGPGPDGDSTTVIPGQAPAPTDVSLTPGNKTATASFTPDSSGTPITDYQISATTDPDARNWQTKPATPNDDGVRVDLTVGSLNNGTTYYVYVRARNAGGPGPEAGPSTVIPGVPLAPVLNAPPPSDQSAVVTFPAPSGGGFAITGYDISVSADPDARNFAPAQFTEADGQVTINVDNLLNGTPYNIFVRAKTSQATGPEGGTTATPDRAPDAPTNVKATAPVSHAPSVPGTATATVTFSAPQGGGGTNPTDSTAFTATATPGGASGSCFDPACNSIEVPNLDNGTRYTFTVNATNNGGTSPESVPVALTPQGAPYSPVSLQRVSATPRTFTVSFVPRGDGGSPITTYEISLNGGKTWRAVGTRISGSRRLVILSGLPGSTRYVVAVRARNKLGFSYGTGLVSILTGPGTVGRPSAHAGTSGALVRWPASAGRDVVGYTVTSTSGARCYTQTRTENSCIIGNRAGVRTYYRVYARNATGISYASAASNTVRSSWPSVPSRVPGVPDGFAYCSSKVKSGKTATLTARGFLPSSSVVLVAYGAKRHIVKRFVTTATGSFIAKVTMPKDTAKTLTFVALGSTPFGSSKAIGTLIRRG